MHVVSFLAETLVCSGPIKSSGWFFALRLLVAVSDDCKLMAASQEQSHCEVFYKVKDLPARVLVLLKLI